MRREKRGEDMEKVWKEREVRFRKNEEGSKARRGGKKINENKEGGGGERKEGREVVKV